MTNTKRAIYIASLEPQSGKLLTTLGMMELASRVIDKIGFFRPIIKSRNPMDNDLALILSRYNIRLSFDKAHCFTVDEVQELGAKGKFKEILQKIIERYHEIKKQFDFLIVEGFESSGLSAGFDIDANLEISRNLGASFIGVINGKGQDSKEILEEVKITSDAVAEAGCFHLATIVNLVRSDIVENLTKLVNNDKTQNAPVYIIPEIRELSSPTIGEIMEELECRLLYGNKNGLERIATQFKVAAMTLDNYLSYLENGDLVITPGDREDIIIGTLASLYSKAFPNISGILLTGGLSPGERVKRLIEGLGGKSIPILSVNTDTFSAAMNASRIKPKIMSKYSRKVAIALGAFEARVNLEELRKRLTISPSDKITPLMFEYRLFEWAKRQKKKIVLPEGTDERILRAAEVLKTRNVVDIIILGKKEEIFEKAAVLGLDLQGIEICDHTSSELLNDFIEEFYKLRRHKGITRDASRDAMLDVNYFGVMMVYKGLCDGMVSGAQHATQDVLRPAFQIIKTRQGIKIASSVFFMCLPDKVLVFGDCAVNPDPNSEELAAIAISSADTAKAFEIEPRVAMLSYSTGDSGKGKDVEKVIKAVEIAQKKRPDLLIEGPLQYDAAIDPKVARKKAPGSKVAGNATVFIFPDLNTGNNTYKAVQRSSNAVAIGPIIQGLKKPVNDLSRGCLVEDVINTVAITAIQAQRVST